MKKELVLGWELPDWDFSKLDFSSAQFDINEYELELEGAPLVSEEEIKNRIEDLIDRSDCRAYVFPLLINDFAHFWRNYEECEYIIYSKQGLNGVGNIYAVLAKDYMNHAMSAFNHIRRIIEQNCPFKVDLDGFILKLQPEKGRRL